MDGSSYHWGRRAPSQMGGHQPAWSPSTAAQPTGCILGAHSAGWSTGVCCAAPQARRKCAAAPAAACELLDVEPASRPASIGGRGKAGVGLALRDGAEPGLRVWLTFLLSTYSSISTKAYRLAGRPHFLAFALDCKSVKRRTPSSWLCSLLCSWLSDFAVVQDSSCTENRVRSNRKTDYISYSYHFLPDINQFHSCSFISILFLFQT